MSRSILSATVVPIFLGTSLLETLPAAEPAVINLAAMATITASSELRAQGLVAASIADGRIAPALSQHFEFYPGSRKAKSWAVDGETAEDKGELVLEWPEPIMIQEVIYFGRTAWLLDECWKDYSIFINDSLEPVATGTFQKKHGGQRVTFPRQEAGKLTLRFHNSYGGPNPGATEILVLDKNISDGAVANLAPTDPPSAERPPDPVGHANVTWETPGAGPEDAMPLGNGRVLANVRTEKNGLVWVSLARISNPAGPAEAAGAIGFRIEPGLDLASLRQSLRFKFGEVVVKCPAQTEKPVFSFFVDANRDVVHLQLRCAEPVKLTVFAEGHGGGDAIFPDAKRIRYRMGRTGVTVLGDGHIAGAGNALHPEEPKTAFDLQIHLVSSAESAEDAALDLDQATGAVTKADVNGAVTGQIDAWNKFWNRGTIHLGGDQDSAAIAKALVLRRYLSACSGRGPHPLRSDPEAQAEELLEPERDIQSWPAEKSAAAIANALEKARPALRSEAGGPRFPHFWGANFSRLPADEAGIDSFIDTLRSMLIASTGKRTCVLPGWPIDRDVVARVDCGTGLGVEVAYLGGEIERLEVYPKQRTSEVFGVGPYQNKVREALPGPFRMPALISFLNPSWVGPRVGHQNLFSAMKDMHFNGLEGSLADFEATKDAGIYLLVHGVTPWTAHALKDEESVISYYLSDRRKPSSFPRFGQMRHQYEAIDPYHPAEFTTYSQYGGIESFLDTVRPRMLEYYDYHWERQAHLHFHYLEYYRRMALAAGGIPIFRIVHVHGDDVVKMRQTVSMSLAYGIKGIKWWVGWTMFDIHKVVETEPPPLSDIGREVSGINNTMAAFSPSLAPARSVAVYHTAPLPAGTRQAPDDFWAQPSGEHLVMGIFEGARGEHFLTVGNRDIASPHKATLALKGAITAVRHLDKQTREWETLELSGDPGAPRVVIELDKGDIELLRVIPASRRLGAPPGP